MNRNFKRRLLAGLFVPVFGLAAGTAMGQSDTTSSGSSGTAMGSQAGAGTASWDADMFDRLDKNRDGRISREEAEADPMLKDAWGTLDASNQGSVSKSEFESYRATQSGGAGTMPGSAPPPNSGSATTPSTTSPSSDSATPK